MPETFFISDHHFQHAKILTFLDDHGCLIRPEFVNVEDMDEHLIEQHNLVVGPNDKVYFLGDVTWKHNKRAKELLGRMKGKKYLTPGNHDDIPWLADFFVDMYLWKKFPDHNFIASHIPLNQMDMRRGYRSVHGHIHEKMFPSKEAPDPRYFNVSAEAIGYVPVSIEEVDMMLDDWTSREWFPDEGGGVTSEKITTVTESTSKRLTGITLPDKP